MASEADAGMWSRGTDCNAPASERFSFSSPLLNPVHVKLVETLLLRAVVAVDMRSKSSGAFRQTQRERIWNRKSEVIVDCTICDPTILPSPLHGAPSPVTVGALSVARLQQLRPIRNRAFGFRKHDAALGIVKASHEYFRAEGA